MPRRFHLGKAGWSADALGQRRGAALYSLRHLTVRRRAGSRQNLTEVDESFPECAGTGSAARCSPSRERVQWGSSTLLTESRCRWLPGPGRRDRETDHRAAHAAAELPTRHRARATRHITCRSVGGRLTRRPLCCDGGSSLNR